MNDQSRYLVHSITGPIILITVGSLFALDRFSAYPFSSTWPVLLIVIGVLRLFGGSRKEWRNSYRYGAQPQQPGPQGPQQPPPTDGPQGGYR